MAKSVLVIESDDQGRFFLSVEGGAATVGDAPGRAEVLLRDLRVTGIRCEIEVEDDTVLISRPATATGQPGLERVLHAGQGVRLTHSRLHLKTRTEEEEDSTPAPVPASKPPATPAGAPAPAPVEGMFKRLRVIDGADLGRAFRLPEDGSLTIGRSTNHADIILHDLYVSRAHCLVQAEAGTIHVQHREGDNGTLVNGQRITARQELQIGDVLRIGNSHLRLETAHTLDSVTAAEEEDEPTGQDEDESDEESVPVAGPTHELVGQVLGPYSIIELLGRGHSGEVFRARNLKTNVVVALKVLSPDFPANGEELQKFVQSMKAVTQLHHSNLVTVHTAGRSGAHCWIAREYVEGESAAAVAKRLATRGKINWTRAGRVAVHLARALAFLQRHRLVHGNLTPANVLLGEDRTTKLADLMLADALAGSRLQEDILEKKLLAELPYLAPEQTYPDAFVDHLADLYGLGAVVYTLLTGQPPFGGKSPAEIIEQVRKTAVVRPTTHQRDIPAPFEAVVLKLMAKQQEDRYQTAAEVLAAVEAIAAEHQIEV